MGYYENNAKMMRVSVLPTDRPPAIREEACCGMRAGVCIRGGDNGRGVLYTRNPRVCFSLRLASVI